ncbi:MAG: histidine kinase [Flavobacteriales bacterium]|nr:histidine kinase [Flavobacteriales bacterium]
MYCYNLKSFFLGRGFIFLVLISVLLHIEIKASHSLDSLVFPKIHVGDQQVLDSLLPIYHQTNTKTTQLEALHRIIVLVKDIEVWTEYNEFYGEQIRTFLADSSLLQAERNKILRHHASYFNFKAVECKRRKDKNGSAQNYLKAFNIYSELEDRDLAMQPYLQLTQLEEYDDQSLNKLNEIISYYRTKHDTVYLVKSLNHRSQVFHRQNLLEKSLKDILESNILAESMIDPPADLMVDLKIKMANKYFILRDYDKALSIYDDIEGLLTDQMLFKRLLWLSTTCRIYLAKKEYEDAEIQAFKGLALCDRMNNEQTKTSFLTALAEIRLHQTNYAAFYELLDSCKAHYKLLPGDSFNLTILEAKSFVQRNEYQKANTVLQRPILQNVLENYKKLEYLQLHCKTDSALGNWKSAYSKLSSIEKLKEKINADEHIKSLLLEEFKNKLRTMLSDFKVAQDLEDSKNYEKRNTLIKIILILIIGIILVVSIFSALRHKEQKRRFKIEYDYIESKNKLLVTQLNPHFISNALGTIHAAIDVNNVATRDLIVEFSKLIRKVLDLSRLEIASLEDEINFAEQYLDALQKRFEGLSFEIKGRNDLFEEVLIPPLLLQPFIENAVKYGVELNNKSGHIEITIVSDKENNLVRVIIVNHYNQLSNKDHQSYSSEIMRERIHNFNQKYDRNIQLEQLQQEKIFKTNITIDFNYEDSYS